MCKLGYVYLGWVHLGVCIWCRSAQQTVLTLGALSLDIVGLLKLTG